MIAEELLKLDKRYKYIQIIMIDKKNHFEYNTQQFKFLTDPLDEADEFLNNVKPFNAITDTFNDRTIKNITDKNSKDREVTQPKWMIPFKNRKMTAIYPDKNQIEVVTVDKLKQVIPYDILVLCTGAEYAAPWRDSFNGTLDAYERDRVFEDYREKIK